jgi:hypothetical protein
VPSIYDYATGELRDDPKSFEEYFSNFLSKSTKGLFVKTKVGGDYIFCREKIQKQFSIALKYLGQKD